MMTHSAVVIPKLFRGSFFELKSILRPILAVVVSLAFRLSSLWPALLLSSFGMFSASSWL